MTTTATNRAVRRRAGRGAARRPWHGRSFDRLMYWADIAEAGARAEGGIDAPDGGDAGESAA